MTKATPIKKALGLGLISCFRGFVNEHHGRRYGGMQASMDLRGLHPNTQADKRRDRQTETEIETDDSGPFTIF